MTTSLHLNSQYTLPLVDSPLIIEVDNVLVKAIREHWEMTKDAAPTFTILEDAKEIGLLKGDKLCKRVRWTY